MGLMKRPKAPEPTAQQLASERRTAAALDEETAGVERRLKAAARGKLGAKSLLPTSQQVSGKGAASGRAGSGYAGGGIMGFRNRSRGDRR